MLTLEGHLPAMNHHHHGIRHYVPIYPWYVPAGSLIAQSHFGLAIQPQLCLYSATAATSQCHPAMRNSRYIDLHVVEGL